MTAKKDLNKFKKDAEKTLFKITNATQMKKLGQITIGIIKKRTRNTGRGVHKPEGNRVKLKKVTPKYAEWRKKQKDKHPRAARGLKSNLTLTGAMLDKMAITKANKKKLVIGHKDKLNQRKSAAQHEQGRAFLFLGKVEVRELLVSYNKKIGKFIK